MAKRKSEVFAVVDGVVGDCVGSTQQDCVKWMRGNEVEHEVVFVRRIAKLTGAKVSKFQVKEVSDAVGKTRKKRVQKDASGAPQEADLPESGGGEAGVESAEG